MTFRWDFRAMSYCALFGPSEPTDFPEASLCDSSRSGAEKRKFSGRKVLGTWPLRQLFKLVP